MRRWTAEEDRILREVYPWGGTKAVHERLPHRTEKTISMRANINGIRVDREAKAKIMSDAKRGARRVIPLQIAPSNTARTEKMLHVWYPSTPDTLRACAAICSFMSSGKATEQAGPEAQHFFASQAEYLRQLADRTEAKALA